MRRHCTCFPSEGEVTLIVRRHCTCSPIRRRGYTYSEEALYLLPIRRGGYTYSEEALYLLPILRCASLSGLCGGAALMAVPLVRAGRSHALRLGTGTQNDRQSSTPCGNSTSCAKLYLHLLSFSRGHQHKKQKTTHER